MWGRSRGPCPDGVDVFFDNVGGFTLEAAITNLRTGGRVVICGRISQTAGGEPYGVRNLGLLIGKRARIQGFAFFDFAGRHAEARTWLAAQPIQADCASKLMSSTDSSRHQSG